MSSTGDDAAVTPADIAQRLYERMPNLITNSDMDAEMFMELMSLKKDQYIYDTQAYRSRDWEGPHQDEVWVEWVAKAMKAFSAKLTAKENQPLCDKEMEPVIEEICSIYDGVRNLVISDNILQRVQEADQKDKILTEEAGILYQSGGEDQALSGYRGMTQRAMNNIAIVAAEIENEMHAGAKTVTPLVDSLDVDVNNTADSEDEDLFVGVPYNDGMAGGSSHNQSGPAIVFKDLYSSSGDDGSASDKFEHNDALMHGNLHHHADGGLLSPGSTGSSMSSLSGDSVLSIQKARKHYVPIASPPYADGTTPDTQLETAQRHLSEAQDRYIEGARARNPEYTTTYDVHLTDMMDRASQEMLSVYDRQQWLRLVESYTQIQPGDTLRASRPIGNMAKDSRAFRYGVYCGYAHVVCVVEEKKGYYIREIGLAEFMNGSTVSVKTLQIVDYASGSVFAPLDSIRLARARVGEKYPYSVISGNTDRTFCRVCATGFTQALQLEAGLPIAAGTVALAGGAAGASIGATMGTAGVSMGWVMAAGAASGVFAGVVIAVGAAAVVTSVAVRHHKVMQAEREYRFSVCVINERTDTATATDKNTDKDTTQKGAETRTIHTDELMDTLPTIQQTNEDTDNLLTNQKTNENADILPTGQQTNVNTDTLPTCQQTNEYSDTSPTNQQAETDTTPVHNQDAHTTSTKTNTDNSSTYTSTEVAEDSAKRRHEEEDVTGSTTSAKEDKGLVSTDNGLTETRRLVNEMAEGMPTIVAFRIDEKVTPPVLSIHDLGLLLGLSRNERIGIYDRRQDRYFDPLLETTMLVNEYVPRICSLKIAPRGSFEFDAVALGLHPVQ